MAAETRIRMRKILSLLLAITLVCGCIVLPAAAAPGNFHDVAGDAFYHDAVNGPSKAESPPESAITVLAPAIPVPEPRL